MRSLGIAIATYERVEMTVSSFAAVHDDPRVSDVAIADDGSGVDTFNALLGGTQHFEKVRLMLHPKNEGSWVNKRRAVELSTSEWVVLLDSDNVIGTDFLDALSAQQWDKDTLYLPVRGTPALDYHDYSGFVVDRNNVARWLDQFVFQMALNTGNFFMHRQSYLDATAGVAEESFAADGIYAVWRWLSSGRRLLLTPDLSYRHLVHAGHWTQTAAQSTAFAGELVRRMRESVWGIPCVV